MKPVLLIHFKTGERDGVSLEIEKRANILRELGGDVHYITGSDGLNRDHAHVIEELNAETSFNSFLREHCFRRHSLDESTLIGLYYQQEFKLYQHFQQLFETLCPALVFGHNIFSHGCNLPASTALLRALDRYEIPTVAVHHDFWHERDALQQPRYAFIRELLAVHPPKRSYILKHQVINSLAQADVRQRRGIEAERIGDYFDFQQPIPQPDEYNRQLRADLGIRDEDFVVLHATRITGHKVIENALLFAQALQRCLAEHRLSSLGGRTLSRDARVVLLLPNFVEPEAKAYYHRLQEYQHSLGVTAVWAAEHFLPERRQQDGRRLYSFWDSYVAANLVTYTSVQEGFGNQFLEAVYFKKLPVILEYPVFEVDLKPEGYHYISLGSSRTLTPQAGLRLITSDVAERAARQTIDVLQQEQRLQEVLEHNFATARQHHDVTLLQADFHDILGR